MNNIYWFCGISFLLISILMIFFLVGMVRLGHLADVQRWEEFAAEKKIIITEDGEVITSGSPVIRE